MTKSLAIAPPACALLPACGCMGGHGHRACLRKRARSTPSRTAVEDAGNIGMRSATRNFLSCAAPLYVDNNVHDDGGWPLP